MPKCKVCKKSFIPTHSTLEKTCRQYECMVEYALQIAKDPKNKVNAEKLEKKDWFERRAEMTFDNMSTEDKLKNVSPTFGNTVLPAVFSRQQKLEIWLNKRIEKAKKEGKELFLGVPDEWYENPLHCCNNGHINGMYLKSSERGAVCLSCHEPSHIFPSDATQEELNVALS